MDFRFSGLVIFLSLTSGVLNGLATETVIENPKLSATSTNVSKPETTSGEGVTLIIPKASEIKSTNDTSDMTSNSTTVNTIITSETITKTPKPSTTTPKPTTTTPKPTTTTPNPTTTTLKPTTTTPVPVTPLQIGKWVIKDNTTNTVCIIAQMAMQLNVSYPTDQNKILNATINVPANSTYLGNCSKSGESLKLSWNPGHSIQVNFGKNDTSNNFYISGVSLHVNATVLKNASSEFSDIDYTSNGKEFETPLDMSYKCNKTQSLTLVSSMSSEVYKAILFLSGTQFQAYMNKTESEFGAAQDCEIFDAPDIVPIAVGCALAILVLVTLVAYLIGRKRSQNRGYLSM